MSSSQKFKYFKEINIGVLKTVHYREVVRGYFVLFHCVQEVLTQLTSRLASQLNDLTIQVVKEDLTLPTMPPPLNRTTSPPTSNPRTLPQAQLEFPSPTYLSRNRSMSPPAHGGGEKSVVPLQSHPQHGHTGHKHSLGTFPSLQTI